MPDRLKWLDDPTRAGLAAAMATLAIGVLGFLALVVILYA